MMLTVGVDLAAEPTRTAVASIEWTGAAARLVELEVGVGDARIVELSRGASAVGIDCPFGWPIEFADFLTAHRNHEVAPRQFAGKEWRQRIRFRDTDRYVRERIGSWPLSVATDLLSHIGLRGAELLEAFAAAGVSVDRSGAGVLSEVYPAASLRLWGVDVAGYKRDASSLVAAAHRVLAAVPWLTVTPAHADLLARSNDALDSVVACLTARACALGVTERPPAEFAASATIEGWIALPVGSLDDLVSKGGGTDVRG